MPPIPDSGNATVRDSRDTAVRNGGKAFTSDSGNAVRNSGENAKCNSEDATVQCRIPGRDSGDAVVPDTVADPDSCRPR